MISVEELRFVTNADVYKNGVLAGSLHRSLSGEVTFAYLPEYTGPDIALSLPRKEKLFTNPGGGLPPFFAGLLPEGHRLTLLQRTTKTSLNDELTIGGDVPGDVQIAPHGQAIDSPNPLINDPLEAANFRALTNHVDRFGLPGVQTKASASMINMPVSNASEQAILKIDPPEHPHLVINENLHLDHATRLKIPVAQHKVVRDRNGLPVLWVTRFDRTNEQRLALEDATQVLGILPSQKYSVPAEDIVNALATSCTAVPLARRNLYIQFLYAWLTGNGDLHAKNLSILQREGRWDVAPMYDLPCTALYRDFTLALPINGKTKNLKRRDWLAFADSIQLPETVAVSSIRQVLAVVSGIDLSMLPFTGSALSGAQRELRHRRYQIEN